MPMEKAAEFRFWHRDIETLNRLLEKGCRALFQRRIATGVTFAHLQNQELENLLILIEPSVAQNRPSKIRFSTAY